MKQWLDRIKQVPWIGHLFRANDRFNDRLGKQFGAAITYFSVLAVVPVIMFAVAVTGFVTTEVVPQWHQAILDAVNGALGGAPEQLREQIGGVINEYLTDYRALSIVSLVAAMYSGAGWVGNLKGAVRAITNDTPERTKPRRNIVVETLLNFAILLGLLVLLLLTFAISSVATSASNLVRDGLGLDQIPGIAVLIRLVPLAGSLLVGWVLFLYLFQLLPQRRLPRRARMIAALIGAVGLGVLQYAAGLLFGLFAGNAAAAVFGPVIVLMLVLNLFARLVLYLAAWIATAELVGAEVTSAVDEGAEDPRDGLSPEGADRLRRLRATAAARPVRPDPAQARDGHLAAVRAAATPDEDGHVAWQPGGGQETVPHEVAVRSVKVGMGAGYVTGAATGIGLGAVAALVGTRIGRFVAGRRAKKRS